MTVIDSSALLQQMQAIDIPALQEILPAMLGKNFNTSRFGDLAKWQEAVDKLPDIRASMIHLDTSAISIGAATDIDEATREILLTQLKLLHPWRKGPFNFFGIHINTEWRSDWKWDRVKHHIEPLTGKTVLDIGCGSGYHCWRMRGAGAAQVVGIEPTPLFVMQFQAAQKYIQDPNINIIPARLEELPKNIAAFDSVFSMGLLYHRRSPFDHLQELLDTLKPGGQLILETLVIPGKKGEVLVPDDRYSKMGNVWFIPSPASLEIWLKKMGFVNVSCVDINITSIEEQRATDWMRFQSLKDFLDPEDHSKTIEGYPAPQRALFIAKKPIVNKPT